MPCEVPTTPVFPAAYHDNLGAPRSKEALVLGLCMVNPKPAMLGHLTNESRSGKPHTMATQTKRVRVAPPGCDWIIVYQGVVWKSG